MSTWHDPRFRDINIDTEELGNLGEGWEIRYTAHGRRYFVDHINRTTQFTGEGMNGGFACTHIHTGKLTHK